MGDRLRGKLKFVTDIVDRREFFLVKLEGKERGFCTFDDPTGGASIVEGDKSESPPVRTLLAFNDSELAEEYIEKELRGLGIPYRVEVNKNSFGSIILMMVQNQIFWFTFNRNPGDALLSERYRSYQISLKLFTGVLGAFEKAANDQAFQTGYFPNSEIVYVNEEANEMLRNLEDD